VRGDQARSSRPTRAHDSGTLTDAHYWTQTNVGEAINGALSVRLAW
jgi:hypothetical protein